MRLERTREKRDGKTVYIMDGYEVAFVKMTPGWYSNWNIERRWYDDHNLKESTLRRGTWGFKTLKELKSYLDKHHCFKQKKGEDSNAR